MKTKLSAMRAFLVVSGAAFLATDVMFGAMAGFDVPLLPTLTLVCGAECVAAGLCLPQ